MNHVDNNLISFLSLVLFTVSEHLQYASGSCQDPLFEYLHVSCTYLLLEWPSRTSSIRRCTAKLTQSQSSFRVAHKLEHINHLLPLIRLKVSQNPSVNVLDFPRDIFESLLNAFESESRAPAVSKLVYRKASPKKDPIRLLGNCHCEFDDFIVFIEA